jgi:hypothetical protein
VAPVHGLGHLADQVHALIKEDGFPPSRCSHWGGAIPCPSVSSNDEAALEARDVEEFDRLRTFHFVHQYGGAAL